MSQDLSGEGEGESVAVARGKVLFGTLHSGERFVLRRYFRGGVIRYVSRDRFLKSLKGSYRPFEEFEIISALYLKGIAVPEPLFAVVQPGLVTYSGVIATAQVDGARNFLDLLPKLSAAAPSRLARMAGIEAAKMLRACVFHPDLHPGNIIITTDEQVVLLDFDKAIRFHSDELGHYISGTVARWKRFVDKYSLDIELVKAFNEGLTATNI